MAFYTEYEIKNIVPKIKSVANPINIRNDEEVNILSDYQRQVIKDLLDNRAPHEELDDPLMMLFLSGPEDKETIKLPKPIEVDTINDKTGKRVPLMFGGVRYVTLESLKNARYTSELVFC